jgi:predicted transcriptional regulator
MAENEKQSDIASLTVELLSAYLANNAVPSADLAGLIQSTRAALTQDAAPAAPEAEKPTFTPAVTARKSLASPDHLISLIDGKPYKTLKRHLTRHGLTPETYRERYGLPASYPMVAPSFAAMRRAIAEKIGLGNKKAADAVVPADAVAGADAAEATDVAAKPKKQAAKTAAAKAAKAPARKAKTPAKATATSAETVPAPVADVADSPVEPQVVEQAVETLSAPRTATKTAARAPARGAAPKKQPTKRMAPTPKPAAKSEAAAPVSGESSPAEIADVETTDAPATAEKPKRRGKLGLFGNEADDTGAATETPAAASGAAKTRWKRPAAKAK